MGHSPEKHRTRSPERTAGKGDNPAEILSRGLRRRIDKLLALTNEVSDEFNELRASIQLLIQMHSISPPEERPKIRNGFSGEVHLEEIELEALLTLDPKTGCIRKIEILPPNDTKTKGAPERHILRTVLTGSEYVKETLAAHWTDDVEKLRAMEDRLEEMLLGSGTVMKDGRRLRIRKITSGQLPSSRAWVNPHKTLRSQWEPNRRALRRERLKLLRES